MPLSKVLGVGISWFFEDAPSTAKRRTPAAEARTPANDSTTDQDPMTANETVKLVRAYYMIEDPKVRKKILHMVRAVSPISSGRKAPRLRPPPSAWVLDQRAGAGPALSI